jgi:hypothetical protein
MLGTHWSTRKPSLGNSSTPKEALEYLQSIPEDVLRRVSLKPHEFGWRFRNGVSLSAETMWELKDVEQATRAGVPHEVIEQFQESDDPAVTDPTLTYGQQLATWCLVNTPELFEEE